MGRQGIQGTSQHAPVVRDRANSITSEASTFSSMTDRSTTSTQWDQFARDMPEQSYRERLNVRDGRSGPKRTNKGFAKSNANWRKDMNTAEHRAGVNIERENKQRQQALQTVRSDDDDSDSEEWEL
jgi:hypothetical protein